MRVVIIGAGVTGLATAWKLSDSAEVVILERSSVIGGLARSFKHGEFTLDSGPHKIYSLIPGILDEMRALLGSEAAAIPKTSSIIIAGKRLSYPIRFTELLLKLPPLTSVKLGFGFGIAMLKSFFRRTKPITYAQYFRVNFGNPAYEIAFKPIAQKSFGNLDRLAADLAQRRTPYTNVLSMIKSMLIKDKKLSAEHFYYPKQGFVKMSEILLEKVEKNNGKIVFGAEVERFDTVDHKITSVVFKHEGRSKKIDADFVVSTMPINVLPRMFNSPPDIVDAASSLKFRSLLLVYVIVNKPRIMEENWVFVPDPKFIFQRVSEQKNFSSSLGPQNQSVLTAEVMCNSTDPIWTAPDSEIYEKVIPDLVKADFVKEGENSGFFVLRLKNSYPVYDLSYSKNLSSVLKFLDQYDNFITLGRLGLFNYNNTDHSIDMAIWAANHIKSKKPISEWINTRKRFDSYTIVD